MDLTADTDQETFRTEVRSFLTTHLPDDWQGYGALSEAERQEFAPRWRETLLDNGYLAVAWPKEYGGAGLGLMQQVIVQEEFVRSGAPLLPIPSDSFGFSLIGPTILHAGTDDQRARFLPKIVSGEHRWCQGYSEPEAGSDLFGLKTRAVRDGDNWIVNGQKVWQTAGLHANWIFALARTDPDAPKAKGLSMLLLPMDQPGVEVRPIRTMTGREEFCEVFFTDAVTHVDNMVGEVNDGARMTMTLLGFERGASSGAAYLLHRQELERLCDLVQEQGRADDPWIRQELAWCFSKVEIFKYLGLRTLTRAASGKSPGPESSMSKLYTSEYHKRVARLSMDVLGLRSTYAGGAEAVADLGPEPLGSPNSPAAWQRVYMTSLAATIYGGSSQIQRNTLGERVLGLPREPRPTTTG
jgi:alkylation response protein AidB-like acyl-CoA dehydrogenase